MDQVSNKDWYTNPQIQEWKRGEMVYEGKHPDALLHAKNRLRRIRKMKGKNTPEWVTLRRQQAGSLMAFHLAFTDFSLREKYNIYIGNNDYVLK